MVNVIALNSIIPIRKEPSETAEQLTQMLFAQTGKVIGREEKWLQLRLDEDGQTGWADRKMLTIISNDEKASLADSGEAKVVMPMAYAVSQNGQTIPLTAGTLLPHYKTDGSFSLLGAEFRIDPQMVLPHPQELNSDNIMRTTRFFLNVPYLWGGKNAMGMDCSGFTQIIMSLFGKHLLRNASEQAKQGKRIASLKTARTGDLVFFNHADTDPDKTQISHIGILIDNERVIHCSGRVKVEKIDDNGILSYEPDGKAHYTHHLAAVRRV